MKRSTNNRKSVYSSNGLVDNSGYLKPLIFDINDPLIVNLSRIPKTRYQIADEYLVSVRVLNKWLIEKGVNIPQGLICPADLRIIYASLGPPHVKKCDQKS